MEKSSVVYIMTIGVSSFFLSFLLEVEEEVEIGNRKPSKAFISHQKPSRTG